MSQLTCSTTSTLPLPNPTLTSTLSHPLKLPTSTSNKLIQSHHIIPNPPHTPLFYPTASVPYPMHSHPTINLNPTTYLILSPLPPPNTHSTLFHSNHNSPTQLSPHPHPCPHLQGRSPALCKCLGKVLGLWEVWGRADTFTKVREMQGPFQDIAKVLCPSWDFAEVYIGFFLWGILLHFFTSHLMTI